jgi:6-phosphogluconolactonase
MEFIVNYKIDISKSIDELSEKFAQILFSILKNEKRQINIALSGGSTPKTVFDYLSDNYKTKIDWNRINFFWGDERCVPSNHPESNYLMTQEHLFNKINISPKNVFMIDGGNNPKLEAQKYSEVIRKNVPLENSIPSFDLIILGLGKDGHTASIFPNNIKLIIDNNICAIAEQPVTHQKRITLTGTVINNAKKIVFLVTGESKNKTVDIILNRKEGYEKLPAAHIIPTNGKLVWLLDNEAINI